MIPYVRTRPLVLADESFKIHRTWSSDFKAVFVETFRSKRACHIVRCCALGIRIIMNLDCNYVNVFFNIRCPD